MLVPAQVHIVLLARPTAHVQHRRRAGLIHHLARGTVHDQIDRDVVPRAAVRLEIPVGLEDKGHIGGTGTAHTQRPHHDGRRADVEGDAKVDDGRDERVGAEDVGKGDAGAGAAVGDDAREVGDDIGHQEEGGDADGEEEETVAGKMA